MRPRGTRERDLHVDQPTAMPATKMSQRETANVVILAAHRAGSFERRCEFAKPWKQVLAGISHHFAAMPAGDLAPAEVGMQGIAVALLAAAAERQAAAVTRRRRSRDARVTNCLSTQSRSLVIDTAIGRQYYAVNRGRRTRRHGAARDILC